MAKSDKKAKKDKKGASGRADGTARAAQQAAAKAAGAAADAAASAAAAATEAIVKRGAKLLSKTDAHRTVGGLEAHLLKLFPADTAEAWDRTGVLVGERALPLSRVAITLDPTVSAIEEAARAGADVLLTHHPAYLSAPESFAPARSVAQNAGAGVWAAIKCGVCLMCFHTALDVSRQAQSVLPELLGLEATGTVLSPLPSEAALGYGQVCTASKGKDALSLAHLAARCTSVFGRAPRVWGRMDGQVRTVATATGSASNVGALALAAGVDCLVCGEVRYHDALDLSQAGLSIIELGHDVSEFPLTAVLADAVASYGVGTDQIIILDQTSNWAYPESIRL